jgi:hypothetical protein
MMAIELLNARKKAIILQCMKAVAGVIDEWEMHTRLGLTKGELQAVIDQWPSIDDRNGFAGFLAINNSLNEICHGLRAEEWAGLIDAEPDKVKSTYQHWLALQNVSGGIQ